MNTESDQRLVRAYAERRSEAAFAELVRRHIDLVYSVAPWISTLDGNQAQVFVGRDLNPSGGETRFIGTKVDMRPHLTEDGQAIDVNLGVQYDSPDVVVPDEASRTDGVTPAAAPPSLQSGH